MADIAHIAGLIAGGAHPSPVGHAPVITTTTHKTLRGPRGAMIMSTAEHASALDKAVFPGLQGGPHNHTTAAIAVALHEAARPEFAAYAHQIVANAKALADALVARGFDLVSGGTDNHLILIDLTSKDIPGKPAAKALDRAGLETNYNTVPFDPRKPFDPSGLRIGTPAITTRGLRDGLMADLVRREVRPPAAGLHEENAVLEGLRAFGRRCGYREPHAEQVAQLSLSLFDQLRSVHRLGPEERALLHAAALLHDVGTFVSYNRHHKHGYYLLFYADLPGFTDRERELIATIARYHRRSVPKDRHEVFQLLTPAERIVVRKLAAILRVADGLDRGHRRQVRRLEVSRRGPGMRIDVWAEKGADLEVWSAQQKSDLLAEVCRGAVRFRLHVVSTRR